MHHQQQSVSKNELFDFVCGESRNFFCIWNQLEKLEAAKAAFD